MATLEDIYALCQHTPPLLHLSYEKLTTYISLIRLLKDRIAFAQVSTFTDAPLFLPPSIQEFIQDALDLDIDTARQCWQTLGTVAWTPPHASTHPPDLASLLPLFLEHGVSRGISLHEFLPPVRTCIVSQCPQNPANRLASSKTLDLREQRTHQATLFTRALGPVPVHTTSIYCRGCLTRYHHNCFVTDNIRTYYSIHTDSRSAFEQISTRFFIESALCERFATQMCFAWTSAQNCARIYNCETQEHEWATDLPPAWPVTFELGYEQVQEAFFLHCLLDWHAIHSTLLQVPHRAPNQRIRFHEALQARNVAMSGTGQPEWNHACDCCTKHVKDADGNLTDVYRSVVTDGISIGHPCCAVRDCKEPLQSTKHRHCAMHISLRDQCVIETCSVPVQPSFRTCASPSHRAAEVRHVERSKALFQLKRRLAKSYNTPPVSSVTREDDSTPVLTEHLNDEGDEDEGGDEEEEEEEEEEIIVNENGEIIDVGDAKCDEKPAEGLRKVYARFGWRRTHNEQLCVGSCGMILGQATFYGAEGPNSVRLFWKKLFPTKASLPAIMWFDTNCTLSAMLAKDQDSYFDRVAMPVDVFHFKCKHKESDGFCGRNCNPARWPELFDEKTGKWVFNSSAAEQVNVWFGGFHAITRLMREDRFNFFLDEMIMRRNRVLHGQLEAAGHAPYSIPREALLGNME